MPNVNYLAFGTSNIKKLFSWGILNLINFDTREQYCSVFGTVQTDVLKKKFTFLFISSLCFYYFSFFPLLLFSSFFLLLLLSIVTPSSLFLLLSSPASSPHGFEWCFFFIFYFFFNFFIFFSSLSLSLSLSLVYSLRRSDSNSIQIVSGGGVVEDSKLSSPIEACWSLLIHWQSPI